jgi:hypothetical protein
MSATAAIRHEVPGVRKPSEHLTIQDELGKLPNSVEFSAKNRNIDDFVFPYLVNSMR